MAPRRQWEANAGYCGEISTISALLYLGGGYMSQYDMRLAATPRKTDQSPDTQYLLGVNDDSCAEHVGLESEAWDPYMGSVYDFISWVKKHI